MSKSTTGKFSNRLKERNNVVREAYECPHKVRGKYVYVKPMNPTQNKPKVSVTEVDGTVREIIIPNRNPVDVPGYFPMTEFNRLKTQAKVVTREERLKALEESKLKHQKLEDECRERKQQLANAQKTQNNVPGSKLDNVETEATQKNLYLLKRSSELMAERDTRVKQANRIILATKCRAIRNAQLREKELMKKEQMEEEKRLDLMMEQERQQALLLEEQKKEEDRKKSERRKNEIMQQIKENEIERLLKMERTEEESKLINKALMTLQKDEEEKLKQKRIQQEKLREEFNQANREAEYYKQLQAEEQRIADLRVQEFMRKKIEREEALEREQAAAKAAKEREIARLRAQQERAQDLLAAAHELNALKAEEEKEKIWREKEIEEARKRKATIEELKKARAKQIEDIRMAQAISLQRDEEDFNKVSKIQRELYEKEKEKEKIKQEQKLKHKKELLKQITEKEWERINQQREKFEEGRAQRLEFEAKDRGVQEYIKQKIQKLKEEHTLDEDYVKDIERQLKLKM